MRSIRHHLTRELFLVLAGGGILVITGMYLVFWRMLVQSFDDRLLAQSQSVQALTEFEDNRIGYDFSSEFLASYGPARPRNFFALWDRDGHELMRSPSLRDRTLPWVPGKNPRTAHFSNVPLPDGRPGRMVSIEFVANASGGANRDPTPVVRLTAAVDREDLNETLRGLLLTGLGGVAVLVAGMIAVVPRVLRRGLQPVAELAEQTRAIDADSLAFRFAADALPVELQPVGRRLNDLLARLEASFERERHFSADLAHELRTPLAELRSQAECALRWPDQRDPGLDQETLAIARHMETLVGHLLALTRGEQGWAALDLQALDLAAAVEAAWRPFLPRVAEKKLRASLVTAPALHAQADPALLRAILTNLLDNAVAYTVPGGEIDLHTRMADARVTIELVNGPVDLAPEDVGRLFDRFWRREPARSDRSHFGLGLPLCRSFAQTMGWTLVARLADRKLRLALSRPVP